MQKMFIVLIHVLLASPLVISAAEQPYFQGKTITLQVGAPAGGEVRGKRRSARCGAAKTPRTVFVGDAAPAIAGRIAGERPNASRSDTRCDRPASMAVSCSGSARA